MSALKMLMEKLAQNVMLTVHHVMNLNALVALKDIIKMKESVRSVVQTVKYAMMQIHARFVLMDFSYQS